MTSSDNRPGALVSLPVGVRVALCVAAIALSIVISDPRFLAAECAVLLVAAPLVGADLLATLRRFRPMALLFASILVVHAWANPANHTPLWGPFYVEGFRYGLVTALRLAAFVLAADILVLSVGTRRLVRSARSLNADLGIMLAMSLAIIPVLQQQAEVTLEAQKARGLDLEAGLATRLRAYLAAVVPVIVKALVRGHAMAALLQVRGYARPLDSAPTPEGIRIDAEALSAAFAGRRAFGPLTFSAPTGEVLGVTGPNGSGKTVLLEVLAGLHAEEPATQVGGSLRFDGAARTTPTDPAVAMALQDSGVHLFDTVAEEIGFPLENAGLSDDDARVEVTRLLDAWGLPGFEERLVRELSGGERQRVALATAEATAAPIALFDEPFEQLDADAARLARARVQALANEAGRTVLVASRRGDWVAGIASGSVALAGQAAGACAVPAAAGAPGPLVLATARALRAAASGPAFVALDGAVRRFEGGGGIGPVSLQVSGGEVVALLGPNGAGKTTLLRLLLGLEAPSAGSVQLGGTDISVLKPIERATIAGVVFQDPDDQLFSETVAREVGWGLKLRGVPADEVDARVSAVLEELGLATHAQTNPHELTRADRQLVALASALVGEPKVIVLDEPTTALDDASIELALQAVGRRVQAGACAIVATHDARIVGGWAERAIRIEQGRIVWDTDITAEGV